MPSPFIRHRVAASPKDWWKPLFDLAKQEKAHTRKFTDESGASWTFSRTAGNIGHATAAINLATTMETLPRKKTKKVEDKELACTWTITRTPPRKKRVAKR